MDEVSFPVKRRARGLKEFGVVRRRLKRAGKKKSWERGHRNLRSVSTAYGLESAYVLT
jgi:hypothetical protein